MAWLKGKKAILGSIAAGLLATMYGLDLLVHDVAETPDVLETGWLAAETYLVIGGWITAWTGVAFRLAIAKGK